MYIVRRVRVLTQFLSKKRKMKQLLILVALSSFAWGSRLPIEANTRIIGGTAAEVDQFPFMASLRFASSGNIRCGGSIIHPKWILTAGHCFIEPKDLNPRLWFVVVGTTFYTPVPDLRGIRHDIRRIIRHENYKVEGELVALDADNDIALLELKRPIAISKHANVIKLNPQPVGQTRCVTIGWGKVTFPEELYPPNLLYLQMQVIPQNVCREIAPPNQLHDSFLCAFSGGRKGFCHADSGGPLVDENGLQIGINSWMILPCAAGKPDVFVRISAYYDWITNHVGVLL